MDQKFGKFSQFRESDKSLMHELGLIKRFCFSYVSCWRCGSMLVCYTKDSRFEYTFFAEIFFSFYRFCRLYIIHLGKTPMEFSLNGSEIWRIQGI